MRPLLGAVCAALLAVCAVSLAADEAGPAARSRWPVRTAQANLQSVRQPGSIVRQHVYGTAGRDDAYDIWPFAGGWVITGSSENPETQELDLVVLRVDAAGNAIWAHTYGGAKRDIGFAVRTVGDDLIVVAGWTHSFGAGEGDFYLLGLDADGESRFAKTFGGPGEERATALSIGTDRGILVLGESYSHGAGDARFYAVKTDSGGTLEWERTYDGGPQNERGLAIVDVDNGWVLVGNTMDTTSGSTATVSDGYVVRIGASGEVAWSRRIGGAAHDILHHAVRLGRDRILASGYTRGHGARGANDVWLVTLDANGRTVAMRTTGGDGEDHNIVARVTSDGRVWLGGYCKNAASSDWDVQLIELDATGTPVETRMYASPHDDGAVSLFPLDRGGVIVAGYTQARTGDRDILLLEVRPKVITAASAAEVEWTARADSLWNSGNHGQTIQIFEEAFAAVPGDSVVTAALHRLLAHGAAAPLDASQRARDLLRRNARSTAGVLIEVREPGIPLEMSGRVLDPEGAPVAGATLYVFHADASGRYRPEGAMDEPNARLFACLRTGADGRYAFRTIRPGGYEVPVKLGSEERLIPAHIHYEIAAPGFVDRRFQLVFDDDPRMDEHWRAWARAGNHPIAQVTPVGAKKSAGVRGVCDVLLVRR